VSTCHIATASLHVIGTCGSGGATPDELAPILAERKRVQAVRDQNEAVFTRARLRLVQRLYHEAFHAYLSNCVYPPADGEMPRWLNEGLAQIFETAIVEVGELRVQTLTEGRLERAAAAAAWRASPAATIPESCRSRAT